ncbi:uncharacterized protein LOC117342690 [Pecten maximus]|uniref:uncharacterized protein LOC117342690 n=1 Tax=Pecten maximus TaxID=6579 RepID=UPI00145814FD|nr:uncharacterized protein LOC117342690 [Pecten maximus]XP_033760788.1 uncharacterized protein LOC117342690 [Pecten maximus]XP_033760789.1 uncharacterized protein LOC117342690 [Pecten maximus]
MRVLTRYKYVQIRVFRPLRRTRRTFCLVLCTVLLFGLFTLLSDIFNTSDRYRTFSMVPYSGNLSELRRQSLVIGVPKGVPKHAHQHIIVQSKQYSHTKIQTLLGHGKLRQQSLVIAAPKGVPKHAHQHITVKPNQYNHTGSIQPLIGYGKPLSPNSTQQLKLWPNISHVVQGEVHHVNITSLDSRPRNTSTVSKENAPKPSINSKPKSKYLSYKDNFSYPLDINLVALVNDSLNGLKFTQHKPINPHNFWYLHKPYNCNFKLKKNASKNVLVLVKSFAGNVAQRVALRKLWQATNDSNMRRAFMLGYSRTHQLAVDNESRKYHDIIQENFVDNYMNNTFKTIMAYNWATRYCRRAHVILFLDDDYLVNMTVMATHVRATYRNQSSGLYAGTLAKHAPPYRDKNERWFLTYKQYPYDEFPPYVGGGAYVVSFDVAKRFKFAFPYVQYMGIDDVFLGIVARKLDINPKNDPYLDSHSKITIAKECSHNATELLHGVCPLRMAKKKTVRVVKRAKHRPVNAVIFVIFFGLAISTIVLLTCCLSE